MSRSSSTAAEAFRGARPGRAGYARTNCPFCEGRVGVADRNNSLALSCTTGWWSCWRCKAKGKLREDEYEAVVIPTGPDGKPDIPLPSLPPGWTRLWEGSGRESIALAPAREYLESRGVDLGRQQEADIGACYDGKAARRIVVPFRAPDGQLLGWIGRSWLKREPQRYMYPPGMPRGQHLFHEIALFDDVDRPVYLVEGVFDALAMWPDCCAFMGKPGGSHLSNLAKSKRPLVALLDGDAWRESEALTLQLRILGKNVTWVKLPAGQDPATVDRLWIESEARRGLAGVGKS